MNTNDSHLPPLNIDIPQRQLIDVLRHSNDIAVFAHTMPSCGNLILANTSLAPHTLTMLEYALDISAEVCIAFMYQAALMLVNSCDQT